MEKTWHKKRRGNCFCELYKMFFFTWEYICIKARGKNKIVKPIKISGGTNRDTAMEQALDECSEF